MAKRWIVERGDKKSSPITSDKLVALARAGKVRPDDMICCEGQDNWQTAGNVKGLFATDSVQSATPPLTKPADPPVPQSAQVVDYAPPPAAQQPVPTVNVITPRRSSSLGIASVILGILAFLICWIPLPRLAVPCSGAVPRKIVRETRRVAEYLPRVLFSRSMASGTESGPSTSASTTADQVGSR